MPPPRRTRAARRASASSPAASASASAPSRAARSSRATTTTTARQPTSSDSDDTMQPSNRDGDDEDRDQAAQPRLAATKRPARQTKRPGPASKTLRAPATRTRSALVSGPATVPTTRNTRRATKIASGTTSDSSQSSELPTTAKGKALAKPKANAKPKSESESESERWSEPEALKEVRRQLLAKLTQPSASVTTSAAKAKQTTRARPADSSDDDDEESEAGSARIQVIGSSTEFDDNGPSSRSGRRKPPHASTTTRQRSSTRSNAKAHAPPVLIDDDDDDSQEEAYDNRSGSVRSQKRQTRGSVARQRGRDLKDFVVSDDDDDDDDDDDIRPSGRKPAKAKATQKTATASQRPKRAAAGRRAKQPSSSGSEESSDFESSWKKGARRKRAKPSAPTQARRPEKAAGDKDENEDEEDDDDDDEQIDSSPPPVRKRLRRSRSDDHDGEIVAIAAPKPRRGNPDDLSLPVLALPPAYENLVIEDVEPSDATLALDPVRIDHVFPPLRSAAVDRHATDADSDSQDDYRGKDGQSGDGQGDEDDDDDEDDDADEQLMDSDIEISAQMRSGQSRDRRALHSGPDDDESDDADYPVRNGDDDGTVIDYTPATAPLEKHWETCRRCGDKPSMHYWERALASRKRLATRNRKKQRLQSPAKKTRSERTSYTRGMFDEGVAPDAAEQQMDEWLDTLESRGGWFECSICTVSSHWGCLTQAFQTAVLNLLNSERRTRHRYLAAEGEPEPEPLRTLAMNEVLDSLACPDCSIARWTCYTCKGDVQGDRVPEELGGPSASMADRLPPPPVSPAAQRLFRCTRCHRCAHYECMPALDDADDSSPDERAKAAHQANWQCGDCRKWPAVDQILAWRPLDRREWSSREARNRSYPAHSPKDELQREYLVKLKDRSFRETVWVPHDWLRITSTMSLHHFLKHGTRLELEPAELIESTASAKSVKKGRASLALGGLSAAAASASRAEKAQKKVKKVITLDDVGQVELGPPGPEPDAQERIPTPWRTPDRILSVLFYSSIQTGAAEPGGEEINADDLKDESLLDLAKLHESWPHVSQMLVKWQDIGYERCTWEDLPSRRKDSDIYGDYQRAYKSFLAARQVAIPELDDAAKRARQERHQRPFRALDDQPTCIHGGELLDFQIEGLNWLRYGWHTHRPGILADEMGLGKTVQIISFLGQLWTEHRAGPFLVVVPNSTLPNWIREFEKWLPQFRVVPYWGEVEARDTIAKFELFHHETAEQSRRKGRRKVKAHVVVASDTAVRYESLPLRKVGAWDVMIVDEGQNLKSGESVLLKRLNEMKSEHRIIMTGTPLNNNIGELFNLLNWLEPGGQWSAIKELKRKYEVLTPELIEELQPKLKPYFLRRIKAEVLDLPPKTELIVPTSLRPIQKRIYRSILEQNIEDIQALTEGRGDTKGKRRAALTNLNNVLMQLRKCIQHPYLIAPDLEAQEGDEGYEASWEHQRLVDASAKLALLQRLLPKLKERGHRVLLFSQFVINLDLVELFLSGEGYKYLRLDGAIGQKQRQKGIDAFNAPGSDYFIYMISTRAGGVGINLATADTVIIFDPDFNPHVDMQAIARAHRIGQTKKVLVFTMMCKATAEEQIIETAKKKMVLDHLIVQNLNNEEDRPDTLESILKFGAQALFSEGGLEENEKDVRYTDEDLDALLDRGEKEEEEDDDTLGGGSSRKSGGRFSYARVWESDKRNDGIGSANAALVDNDFWADLLEKHREDARKKAAEEEENQRASRRRRRDANIRAMLAADEAVPNETAVPQKRGPGRPKGSRTKKKEARQPEDEDFVARVSDASSSGGEFDQTVPDDIRELARRKKSRGYQIPFATNGSSARPDAAPTVGASTSAAPSTSATAQQSKPQPSQPARPAAYAVRVNAQQDMQDMEAVRNLDATVPVHLVGPELKAVFLRCLDALPAAHWDDIRRRVNLKQYPQLSPPQQRSQLTMTHADYFSKALGMPLVLFPAAFTIVPESSIPPEIANLPYGGAVALSASLVREILLRVATYMLLACSVPRVEPPAAPTPMEPPPVASSEETARQILDDPRKSQAWLERVKQLRFIHHGVPESALQAPTLEQRVKMLVLVERTIADKQRQQQQQQQQEGGRASGSVSASPAPNSTQAQRSSQGPSQPAISQVGAAAEAASQPSPGGGGAGDDDAVFVSQRMVAPKKKSTTTMSELLRLGHSHPLAAGSPTAIPVWQSDLRKRDAMPKQRRTRISKASAAASAGSPASMATPTPMQMGDMASPSIYSPSPSPLVHHLQHQQQQHHVFAVPRAGGGPRTQPQPQPTHSHLHQPPPPFGHAGPSANIALGDDGSGFVEGGSGGGGGEGGSNRFIPKPQQRCTICLGPFHFINKCPTMHDVSLASMRWHELINEASALPDDVKQLKTTLKVMTMKLNALRSERGLARVEVPSHLLA
ncbi:hypothetical protein ACQY0O_007526 [Thecaphora frezii]